MTDEERALVRAVCESPGDDLPRLVYADWLEEHATEVACGRCGGSGKPDPMNFVTYSPAQDRLVYERPADARCPTCSGSGGVPDGRRERAEFIRVQVELAGLEDCGERTPSGIAGGIRAGCQCCALRERERELFTFGTVQKWFRAPGPVFDRHTTDPVEFKELAETCHATGISAALVRRGFVSSVRCTLAALLGESCTRTDCFNEEGDGPEPECMRCNGTGRVGGCAVELFRSQPVQAVTPTCREPLGNHGVGTADAWVWLQGREGSSLPWEIPPCLWCAELAESFDSEDAAMDALSARLVAHCRSLAGLPSLTPALDHAPPAH